MNDHLFMRRCLELAAQGRGKVGNGALVGAVLVRNGKIIAESFHREYGSAHAEAALLESFSSSINAEDVLYVNLEPCCHHGKTPPCTDAIITRGIKHVVYGMPDPDPRVSGAGIERLRAAGVDVTGGMERALCERLNRGFITVRTQNRPWITLKEARTKSGLVAKADGSPLKITSPMQDQWSHTFLRSQVDAILVGAGTIARDDPSLNTRFAQIGRSILNNKIDQFNPFRIVLDPDLSLDEHSTVLTDESAKRTILTVTPGQCDSSKADRLRNRGVRILFVPLNSDENGEYFSWPALWSALTTPRGSFHGITSILVEGGPATWEAFRRAGCIDEEVTLLGQS